MTLTPVGEPTNENMAFRDDATGLGLGLTGAELTPDGIRGTVTVTHKGNRVGRDCLLLASRDKRRALAKDVAGLTGLEVAPVDNLLADLDDAAGGWLAPANPTTRQPGAPLTEEEREALTQLASLLDDVRAFIRRHVVMTEAQADAVALWVAHTHAFGAAESTPYLSVTSAEKRSGKTRLLETLEPIVARPWFTGRVTAAALYRRVDAERPSLLLDESDSAFKSGEEYAESLRGVLNSGHRRGGATTVCVGQGANMTYGVFSTFSPKAIAGIGKLPDTVADRAIPITLKRRGPGEEVERFKWRKAQEEAAPLRDRLAVWGNASIEALGEACPDILIGIDDRAFDGWEPLLAIANMAGQHWPERARNAALSLSAGDGRDDDDSWGVQLLRDIRTVFDERGADKFTCGKLVAGLVAIEEAPWGDLKGKALDTRRLGWRLRPYGIRSRTIRLDDDSTARGYHREMFTDAWFRYCPALENLLSRPSPEKPTQPTQPTQVPFSDTTNEPAAKPTQPSTQPTQPEKPTQPSTQPTQPAKPTQAPDTKTADVSVVTAVSVSPETREGVKVALSPAPEIRETSAMEQAPRFNLAEADVSDVSDVSLNTGARGKEKMARSPSPDFDREGATAYVMSTAEAMEFPLDSGHRIGPGRRGYERRLKGMGDDELREMAGALEERLSE